MIAISMLPSTKQALINPINLPMADSFCGLRLGQRVTCGSPSGFMDHGSIDAAIVVSVTLRSLISKGDTSHATNKSHQSKTPSSYLDTALHPPPHEPIASRSSAVNFL